MPDRIRPIALAIMIHDSKLFVFEGYDPVKGETFYRPLGGGIDFGERGEDTVAREIYEELGAEIINIKLIDFSENIFTYYGNPHHEIVFSYKAEFKDQSFLEDKEYIAKEDNDDTFKCSWISIDKFKSGELILVPPTLLDCI